MVKINSSHFRIKISISLDISLLHTHTELAIYLCNFAFKLDQFSRRPRLGTGNRDTRAQPYKLTARCDVTAILILYGLPR